MGPGHTQFTRIPSGAWSIAIARVSWTTAPLDAQYAAAFGRGDEAELRGDVHDRPSSAPSEMGNRRPAGEVDARDVHGDDAFPFGGWGTGDRAAARNSGAGNDRVQPAERRDHLVDGGGDLDLITRVGGGAGIEGGQTKSLDIAIDSGNTPTVRAEAFDGGSADPGGSSGDEGARTHAAVLLHGDDDSEVVDQRALAPRAR